MKIKVTQVYEQSELGPVKETYIPVRTPAKSIRELIQVKAPF